MATIHIRRIASLLPLRFALPSMSGSAYLAAVALAVVLLSGCLVETKPRSSTFMVDNRTPAPITVTIHAMTENPDGRTMAIPAGNLFGFSWVGAVGSCDGTGAVAIDPDGKELARLSQPVCDGQRWVFEPDGRIHLEPGRSPR